MGELSTETALVLLRRMLLIRRAEEQVIHFATDRDDLLIGHYHVYIGQEAVGAGVCQALAPEDYVFTTHRNHGHVIARGGELGPVLAEIIGKETGYNKGRGGTFHVAAPHLNILHSSAIVGGCVPLAAGAALSAQQRKSSQISVAFFGEGAMDEGASYEALAIAALWQLPILFVCETNGMAGGRRGPKAGPELLDRAAALGVQGEIVDGIRAGAVYEATCKAAERVRWGNGPIFLQMRTGDTWPGHHPGGGASLHGGDFDLAWSYDPASAPEQLRGWVQDSDPVSVLLREGPVGRDEALATDKAVRAEAAAAGKFALDSPFPAPERAHQHVLVG